MWADWGSVQNRHWHFYVKELAFTIHGTFVFIQQWIIVDGVMHADVVSAHGFKTAAGGLALRANERQRILASDLLSNVLEIEISVIPK